MVIPSSCALSNLDPAASPATKKSVFEDTEDDAFPPRDVIASAAPSLVKSTNEPVTTRVNPARVCLIFSFGASTNATCAFSHFFYYLFMPIDAKPLNNGLSHYLSHTIDIC